MSHCSCLASIESLKKLLLENKKRKKSALDAVVVGKQVLKSSVVGFARGLMNSTLTASPAPASCPGISAAGQIKPAGKERAAHGEALSPLGAFPPLPRSTAIAWEQRHRNEPKSSEECEDHQTGLNVKTNPDI